MSKTARDILEAFARRFVEELATHGASMLHEAAKASWLARAGQLAELQARLEQAEARLDALLKQEEAP